MEKLPKLPYEDFIKSFTPFYINDEVDQQVLSLISEKVKKYIKIVPELVNHESIIKFIKDDSLSLEILLSITDISSEKFKRIISTLRLERGDVVSTEWSLKRTRIEILQNNFFEKELIEMFLYGVESDLGKKLPAYYLQNTGLSSDKLA